MDQLALLGAPRARGRFPFRIYASTLARDANGVNMHCTLSSRSCHQDPVLSQVKLIAESVGCREGGISGEFSDPVAE